MSVLESTVKKVVKTVRRMLKTELPENFFFHNIHHTEDVVSAAIEIGSAINLSEEELEIVQISSWFHDVGYCYKYDGHEEVSIDIAKKILRKLNYPKDKLLKVLSCIARLASHHTNDGINACCSNCFSLLGLLLILGIPLM